MRSGIKSKKPIEAVSTKALALQNFLYLSLPCTIGCFDKLSGVIWGQA
jgi:hypothetical protein